MTAPTITPRPYQEDALGALDTFLRERNDNPCIVIPTGGGKSPTMATFAHRAVTQYPGTRILVLAHVRELVRQNADKMLKVWPDAPMGIYSAGLNRRDRFEPIIFASIQSVHSKAMLLGRFDLILVDECHRIPLKAEGTYRKFIEEETRINPALRVIGFTASPWRMGGGPICAPDHVLNAVALEVFLKDLIADGYLSPLISKNGVARPDLAGMHLRNGDYVESEVAERVTAKNLVARACNEIVDLCADRRAWLLFAANVSHAESIHAELSTRGLTGRVVTGETNTGERDAALLAFKHGHIRFLVTINVLSEGYDEARIDAIIMLRPTKSPVVYSQQVGRGTRIIYAPGFDLETKNGRVAAIASGPKPDCLVLDFAGNILEHGPVDCIVVAAPKRKGAKGEIHKAPVKECPMCHVVSLIQVTKCPCGYEWPKASLQHDDHATNAPILSTEMAQRRITEYQIKSISYGKHEKKNSPPSMCVVYSVGELMPSFREWVTFEHSMLARARAVQWWNERNTTRELAVPQTVNDALDKVFNLREPKMIRVNESTKHPEILGFTF